VIVTSVARNGHTVLATLRHPDHRTDQRIVQQLLVATGRGPVTNALNLATVGVKTGNRAR
jgi:pyruvate/2-oxoglutarate dehydrogenase complex dihydrolipoamide dehydrogenase (E3) component